MILIPKIIGNSKDIDISGLEVDFLDLEWFETSKPIIRKFTRNGVEVGIRKDPTPLEEDDVIYIDNKTAILVSILSTPSIVFRPKSVKEMAVICFEIGNKHIPIYINDKYEVIIAFEQPLFHLMKRYGYQPIKENRKILKASQLGFAKHLAKRIKPIKFKDNLDRISLTNKKMKS